MILPVLDQFAVFELQLRQNWKDEQFLGHCILDLETLTAFFLSQKKITCGFLATFGTFTHASFGNISKGSNSTSFFHWNIHRRMGNICPFFFFVAKLQNLFVNFRGNPVIPGANAGFSTKVGVIFRSAFLI